MTKRGPRNANSAQRQPSTRPALGLCSVYGVPFYLFISHLLLPVTHHTHSRICQLRRQEVSRPEDRKIPIPTITAIHIATAQNCEGVFPQTNIRLTGCSAVTLSSGTTQVSVSFSFQLLQTTNVAWAYSGHYDLLVRSFALYAALSPNQNLQRRSHSYPTSQPGAKLETWGPKKNYPSKTRSGQERGRKKRGKQT